MAIARRRLLEAFDVFEKGPFDCFHAGRLDPQLYFRGLELQ